MCQKSESEDLVGMLTGLKLNPKKETMLYLTDYTPSTYVKELREAIENCSNAIQRTRSLLEGRRSNAGFYL